MVALQLLKSRSREVSGPAGRRLWLALLIGGVLGSLWLAAPAAARPIYLPPSLAGWPGGVVDETDLTRYLAFYKSSTGAMTSGARVDETPNQAAYDARYYSLDLHPDIPSQVLTASVLIRATVSSGPLTTMDLDFYDNMVVDSVTAGGLPAAFQHAADLLTVTLDHSYATGQTIVVRVMYHGTPLRGAFGPVFGFMSWYNRIAVWTLSEPFGARQWWPCKDYPDDKADSVDVRLTVPTGYITASNGTRVLATDNGVVAVAQWHERYPIATYLVSIASYPYAAHSDWYRYSPADSMEIQFYAYPEEAVASAPANALVKNIIAAYAVKFGEYPFLNEKYGEAETPRGGGMENQTCTSVGAFAEYLTAHELGHSWWGDLVTCQSFHHIWLNEGFATYCEAMWAEITGGPTAYHNYLHSRRYLGAGTVYVPADTSSGRIFDYDLSYTKGAWVLSMLRHVVGDSAFYASLREYRSRHAFGNATTEDFEAACESVSGRDLHKFFQEWIYGEYAPNYRCLYTVQPAGGGYDLALHVDQLQSAQTFTMPIDVVVHGQSSAYAFVLQDSLAAQDFTLHVPSPPTSVALDPDEWILCTAAAGEVGVGPNAVGSLRLAPPHPNPARDAATFSLWLPRPGAVSIELYDVTGARVRRIDRSRLAGGWNSIAWDARNDAGRRVQAGIYLARIAAGGERRTQRIALLP